MQVAFVLQLYYMDKRDKIDHLINPCLKFRLCYSVVKQLLYVSKLFRFTAGSIHFFGIHSKETLRIMYPKYVERNT